MSLNLLFDAAVVSHIRHLMLLQLSNILCDGNIKTGSFTVKVLDFGVATDTSILEDKTAETGTYRWMAPEVLQHESYSNMADVYSFAVVLWQLISCKEPYVNVSQIEVARKVALERARPPLLNGTPKVIATLIQACWSENPDSRLPFEKICEMLLDIQESNLTFKELKWLDAPLGHLINCPHDELVIQAEDDFGPSNEHNHAPSFTTRSRARVKRKKEQKMNDESLGSSESKYLSARVLYRINNVGSATTRRTNAVLYLYEVLLRGH